MDNEKHEPFQFVSVWLPLTSTKHDLVSKLRWGCTDQCFVDCTSRKQSETLLRRRNINRNLPPFPKDLMKSTLNMMETKLLGGCEKKWKKLVAFPLRYCTASKTGPIENLRLWKQSVTTGPTYTFQTEGAVLVEKSNFLR